MKLTLYTDYSLRTLMYLAINRGRVSTIQDIAELHHISKNHLTKVVHHLGQIGLVETIRGRSGGLVLAWAPEDINIGDVVRQTETDFHMAECFDPASNSCVYSSACVLETTLSAATAAFLTVLDGVTLADMVGKNSAPANTGTVQQPVRLHARRPSSPR
jgi:Rrf2 family nitric oxide-sensitive transcriptional repressor